MITIPITYTGLTPSMAEAVEIVSGQRDTISVQFSFSDDWSAYKLRTAMFSSRTATRAQMIEEDGTAVIPSEVIRNGERYVKISAFGTLERADGDIERYNGRAITLRIDIGGDVEESGGCTDATAYEKLLVRVTALEERVDNLPAGGGGGGSSVALDTTLTKKGYAADAKAVGDALAKKVGEKELDTAVETALAEAKESGEFDGPPGQPGTTPHIGANGNWWIGTTDTGVKAQGDDYVLTEADKTAIAGETAGMVDVPEKLPNPNALTFSGAVSGTYDGSAPLNVVIPSGGGGTGGASVELDTTLTQPGKAADAKAVGDAIAVQNDAIEKKLDADELPAAVETALAEAKESGKFDGQPGQPGEPGTTPHIGANGNWWIGTTDTGVKAQGEPGQPGQPGTTPHIGANGNWWIGTTDTGVKAQGEPGQPGAPGDDYVLTDGDIDEIASAAAGKINISGKADKTEVPNSAAVNADNELVMQRADGDAVAELFKVALPAGGSEWEEVASITTEEEVVSITIPLTKDDAMKISNADNVRLVAWVKASKEETYTEHGTLTVAIRNVRGNGSVMVDYKIFENDTAVPRTDLSYITLAKVAAKVENDTEVGISRIVKKIGMQNQTATVKDMGYTVKSIGFDSSSTTFEIKIDSSIKMGVTTSFSISVK